MRYADFEEVLGISPRAGHHVWRVSAGAGHSQSQLWTLRYIPLGGSRHGMLLTYRNLMLTMFLGGL